MKYVFYLLLLSVNVISFAQQSAEVTYKARLDLDYRFVEYDETSEMSKRIKKLLVKKNILLKELSFVLKFNTNESIYSWNQQMPDETVSDFILSTTVTIGGDGVFYRNIKQKYLVHAFEFDNNEKVRMTILYNKIKWKITNETVTYLGHKIIKAVSGKYFVAWFAPDIPVPFGPGEYGGLPGLILKYNYRSRWIEAVEIKWKKEPIIIERPTEGELKTEQELLKYYRSK